MKQIITGLLAGVVGVALAGCATTKPPAGLETRVESLENRVQVLEADTQSGAPRSGEPSLSLAGGREAVSADAKNMSKKDIQKALKNAGYYEGPVDGKIGPKTRAAIMAFQGDKGLKEDGIPGSQTKEKLAQYLS
jgi:peptidoglycan hydrolase-like protein with peptidoglycan-binding domain